MRVTKDQVKHTQIAEQIKAIGDKYKVSNYDVLFDMYNLFANKGQSLNADTKTLEALRKTDPSRYWVARDEYHRQRVVFDDISKSDLYKALCTKPPLIALEELCKMLHEMYVRLKGSQQDPRTLGNRHPAIHKYVNEENENAQYEQRAERHAAIHGSNSPFTITDPVSLMGQLFADLNNPGSASLFALTASPYLMTQKMDKPDKDADWLIKTAQRYCARGGANFFKWIQNVAGKAGFEEKKDIVTEELSEHKKPDTLDTPAEMINANPADLQRPDLEKQVIDRTLTVTKNTASVLEKSHCVVLLDISGSMSAQDQAGGRCDRALYAFCIIFAMLQKIVERGDAFHIIMFEGSPHACQSATTQDEAVKLVNFMCHHTRWGGGTNIESALMAGIRQLKQVQKFRHADILLITDGEGAVDVEKVRNALPPKTKIRGIHIGSTSHEASSQMVDLCDAAMVAKWDYKQDMPLLGDLLKGV